MATDLRAYDNEHGDPVVVMVTTGTFDVSRLVGLMEKGRCEDHDRADAILRGVRRHNGGWYRNGFDGGQRQWLSDDVRGRAGVWFREIVETAEAPGG